MRLVWTSKAVRDLAEIRTYVEQDRPRAAAHLARRIIEAVGRLEDQPLMGRKCMLPGIRELIVAGTPYIVPYRVRGETIELLRVLHGRRKRRRTH